MHRITYGGQPLNQKELILFHQQLYPHMQLQDQVKRIHQCVYGPAHLYSNPSMERITQYITQELNLVDVNDTYPNIIDIGFGYVRVDLKVIKSDLITVDELSKSFHHSMVMDTIDLSSKHELMTHELNGLMTLIAEGVLPYDERESQLWIDHYASLNYPPIHHSDTFRLYYHPHYRVVHQHYLPEKLKK